MLATIAERLRFVFSVPVSPGLLPDGKVSRRLGGERDCGERDCGERDGTSVDKDFTFPEAGEEEPRSVMSSISVLKTYSTIPAVRTRM